MGELRNLPNIGKVTEEHLTMAGITSIEEFRSIGAKEAYLKIRRTVDPGACMSALRGLIGAEMGIKGTQLPEDVVLELKSFYNSL